MQKVIVWFNQDLRLADNPALAEASRRGFVLPVFVFDESARLGQASRVWLHHSLQSLNQSLGNTLNFYCGSPTTILPALAKQQQAHAVFWNRRYEPQAIACGQELKRQLAAQEVEAKSFNASLLWEPWTILKHDDTPYKLFTPFYKATQTMGSDPRALFDKPSKSSFVKDRNNTTTLESFKLLPRIPWDKKILTHWDIGEQAAQKRLANFVNEDLAGYKNGRDYPGKPNVSRLSPHLHFGEISPHQVWHTAVAARRQELSDDLDYFLRELVWREFSYYLLFHVPTLAVDNFNKKFDAFPWVYDQHSLKAWQQGQTGCPLVDAGMRELWQTGYMHNRVRMVTASFLVKNLLIHWHEGERWFFDCLVDADMANNSASWQWVAGSGVDAAPYFRIFNPTTQGEKFDSAGTYTRRYVPELARIPDKFLFKPWQASPQILSNAGVALGKTYPHPLVDLALSRERALEAFRSLRH